MRIPEDHLPFKGEKSSERHLSVHQSWQEKIAGVRECIIIFCQVVDLIANNRRMVLEKSNDRGFWKQ